MYDHSKEEKVSVSKENKAQHALQLVKKRPNWSLSSL
jgi:hypothetical protein